MKRLSIKKAVEYVGSAKRLAEEVGCSDVTIYRWMNGMRKYSPESARALSKAVDGSISPGEFMVDLVKSPKGCNE